MSGREYAELKALSCRANRNWFNTRDPYFDPPEDDEFDEDEEGEEDDEEGEEVSCGSCVHYKDYKCGDENTIKMCECPHCLYQSKR